MTENFVESRDVWRSITLQARHVEAPKETPEAAELRLSRRRLVLAADAERRELERALHDGVQQQLVALAVTLQLARDDPTQLEEAVADVQQTLQDTARLAQRIYPPLLEPSGLAPALRAAAEATAVRASVEVAVAAECSPEVTATVYFCWLAALEGTTGERRTTIVVRDEGNALIFDIVAGGRASLDGLRDRVEALGGRLTIDQGTGGTRVSGSLPAA